MAQRIHGSKGRLAMLGGVLVATAAFFHRAAFSSDIFLGRDVLRGVYPLKAYWAQRVGAGEFPAWFPYDGLGQPFVGMMVSAVFHPTNLLFLVFSLGDAEKIATLGCYPLAFFGVFLWLRRLDLGAPAASLAGLAFACNGFLVGISNNVPYLMAAATVPWVLWAADRFLAAPSVLAAITPAGLLSMVLFAGDPQTFAMSSGFILLVPFSRPEWRRDWRKSFPAAAGVVGLGALFAAPLLVPVTRIFADITAGARPLDVALTWSVHPLQLLEFSLGSIFGGTPDSPTSAAISRQLLGLGKTVPWVESLHLGLPVLVLATMGFLVHRRRTTARVFLGLALVLLLLVLGKFGGLYQLVFTYVPFWRPFRYPVKLLPLLVLLLSGGAAAGFEALKEDVVRRRAAIAFAGCAAVSLGLFAAEALGRAFSAGLLDSLWTAPPEASERLSGAFRVATGQSVIACGALAAILFGVRDARLWQGLGLLVVGLHLFVVNEPHYEVGSRELLSASPPFVEAIRAVEGAPRLGAPRVVDVGEAQQFPGGDTFSWSERVALATVSALTSDTQQLWGFEGANNLMPATSARYARLCKQKDLWLWRYAGMFNTGYAAVPAAMYAAVKGDPREILAQSAPFGLLLLKKSDVRPRAYLARPRCVADAAAAQDALAGARGLEPDEAVVECGGETTPTEPATGEVKILAYAPERVALDATVSAPTVLVLNDAFYAGWTATVDGSAAKILAANCAVRAVRLEAGHHQVVFAYRTPGLALGVAVGALSLLAALTAGGLLRRRASAQ